MSFCGKCGTRLDDNAWRCPNCGMPVPGAQQPEPVYEEPAYPEPVYGQPSYSEPTYEQPSGNEPSYGQPTYQEPSYGQPAYQEPAYGQQAYQEPSYDQPSYQEPAYGQPADPDSGFRRPAYGGASSGGGQRVDFNAGKEAVTDFAGKAFTGAKNFAGQIGKKVEDRNAAIAAKVEEDARRQKEAQAEMPSRSLYQKRSKPELSISAFK